jgi:bifunctional UDP-N-acetylglucosamine pyrophosphorylase/glucosamine-1-phosphate N-acetyltransferase
MTSGASCTILTGYCENPSGYNRVLRNKDGEILKIVKCQEIDEETKKITEINSGVYVFKSKDVFKALKDVKPDSRDNEYFLSDVVEILVKSGKKIESYQTTFTEEITSINSQIDLLNMAVYLKLQIINKHIEKGVTIIDPATTHIEPDVEIGKDTIINPFCVIRNYVKIGENCVVGPFAHLRAGTVLQDGARVGNFVEVKNTKVGKKSKAMHLAYLGDAILGKGVNIGAGTITANFDGIRKNTTVIEDDVFTGCNCVLIAPVKIGKGAVIGANAVVTKGKDVMPGDVVAGVPAKSIKSKSRRK